jgi:hypothetical protein
MSGQAPTSAGARAAACRRFVPPGALLLALVGAPLAGSSQMPTFPAEARLVTIDAIVLDADGRPVPGLRASDSW